MSGLHIRGYRPKAGERARTTWGFDTLYRSRREQWVAAWRFVRVREPAMPGRVEVLALDCLGDRERPDRLVMRNLARACDGWRS